MQPVSGAYSVCAFVPEDESKILELYVAVFGKAMARSKWQWLFVHNAFSRAIVYVAKAGDGRIVGHYAMIPQPFFDGGRGALAALSIQSMVHPSFQKRGILKALAAAAAKQLDEDGVKMGMAFLNDESLHVYTTHFGWTPMEGPNPIFVTVLRWDSSIADALKLGALGRRWSRVLAEVARLTFRRAAPRRSFDGTIRRVDRFDERVDALWERFSASLGRSVDRSARYLNWRLVDNPDLYQIHICEDAGGGMRGFVVTKTEFKFGISFGYLVELIFDVGDIDAGVALASHAQELLTAQGCYMATTLTAGSPDVERVLRRTGFRRLPRKVMAHGIHFCFKSLGTGVSGAIRPEWFLSWLDHDVV